MSQVESFTVGVVFQNFNEQLLSDEDVTTVQFRTVVGCFEQLLSQSNRNERIEVQVALIQSLQLLLITTIRYNYLNFSKPTTKKNHQFFSLNYFLFYRFSQIDEW